MAIVNRHIPKHWNTFYIKPATTRQATLCGRRTATKFQGIPGASEQPLEIAGRPGWCVHCIDALFNFYREDYRLMVTFPEASEAYNIVFFEMLRFMRHCIENAARLGISFEADNAQNLTQ